MEPLENEEQELLYINDGFQLGGWDWLDSPNGQEQHEVVPMDVDEQEIELLPATTPDQTDEIPSITELQQEPTGPFVGQTFGDETILRAPPILISDPAGAQFHLSGPTRYVQEGYHFGGSEPALHQEAQDAERILARHAAATEGTVSISGTEQSWYNDDGSSALSGAQNVESTRATSTSLNRPHPCRYPGCPSTFETAPNLAKHVRRCHILKGAGPHTCLVCGKKCLHPKDLRRHGTTHVRAAFQCNDCKKYFTRDDNRERHKSTCPVRNPSRRKRNTLAPPSVHRRTRSSPSRIRPTLLPRTPSTPIQARLPTHDTQNSDPLSSHPQPSRPEDQGGSMHDYGTPSTHENQFMHFDESSMQHLTLITTTHAPLRFDQRQLMTPPQTGNPASAHRYSFDTFSQSPYPPDTTPTPTPAPRQ